MGHIVGHTSSPGSDVMRVDIQARCTFRRQTTLVIQRTVIAVAYRQCLVLLCRSYRRNLPSGMADEERVVKINGSRWQTWKRAPLRDKDGVCTLGPNYAVPETSCKQPGKFGR